MYKHVYVYVQLYKNVVDYMHAAEYKMYVNCTLCMQIYIAAEILLFTDISTYINHILYRKPNCKRLM